MIGMFATRRLLRRSVRIVVLLVIFLLSAQLSPVWADPVVHTVDDGDTLYRLARQYNTSVDAIKRVNGLDDTSQIYLGQRLIIPENDVDVTPYQPAPEPGSLREYTVQPADTLIGIAVRFGTTVRELVALNEGFQSGLIYAGQRLEVPHVSRSVDGMVITPELKRIEVDVSEQHMWMYEGEELVWDWPASTGLPGYPTRYGQFQVLDKIPMAYSRPWDLWMPNWLGIYWAGGSENGIHSLPIIDGWELWAGYLGSKISYGCVVVGTKEGKLLYDWADVGTTVVIRE